MHYMYTMTEVFTHHVKNISLIKQNDDQIVEKLDVNEHQNVQEINKEVKDA